jgi:hypothetical protein
MLVGTIFPFLWLNAVFVVVVDELDPAVGGETGSLLLGAILSDTDDEEFIAADCWGDLDIV